MVIDWNEAKNRWLIENRGVSFEEMEEHILRKDCKELLNPGHEGQMIFIVNHKEYTHVVPFITDKDGNIFLKTIFRSRRYHKIYGGDENEENQT
jgi:uncharacterized DUF497 family protein